MSTGADSNVTMLKSGDPEVEEEVGDPTHEGALFQELQHARGWSARTAATEADIGLRTLRVWMVQGGVAPETRTIHRYLTAMMGYKPATDCAAVRGVLAEEAGVTLERVEEWVEITECTPEAHWRLLELMVWVAWGYKHLDRMLKVRWDRRTIVPDRTMKKWPESTVGKGGRWLPSNPCFLTRMPKVVEAKKSVVVEVKMPEFALPTAPDVGFVPPFSGGVSTGGYEEDGYEPVVNPRKVDAEPVPPAPKRGYLDRVRK